MNPSTPAAIRKLYEGEHDESWVCNREWVTDKRGDLTTYSVSAPQGRLIVIINDDQTVETEMTYLDHNGKVDMVLSTDWPSLKWTDIAELLCEIDPYIGDEEE